MVDYFFLILAFLSEIIGTISVFGSSILFVPIASLFYDFHTVLGITAIYFTYLVIAQSYSCLEKKYQIISC